MRLYFMDIRAIESINTWPLLFIYRTLVSFFSILKLNICTRNSVNPINLQVLTHVIMMRSTTFIWLWLVRISIIPYVVKYYIFLVRAVGSYYQIRLYSYYLSSVPLLVYADLILLEPIPWDHLGPNILVFLRHCICHNKIWMSYLVNDYSCRKFLSPPERESRLVLVAQMKEDRRLKANCIDINWDKLTEWPKFLTFYFSAK